MDKNTVMNYWIALITRMSIFVGMIGSFISGTVGAGNFIKNLLSNTALLALLALELLILAFFVIIMATLFLQAMRDNEGGIDDTK